MHPVLTPLCSRDIAKLFGTPVFGNVGRIDGLHG
jgi:hypothetical protein